MILNTHFLVESTSILFSGVYMNPIKLSDVKVAADLYYASDKYDLKDIQKIACKFMVENCSPKNCYFLFRIAETLTLPVLAMSCRQTFSYVAYEALKYAFDESPDDDLLAKLIGCSDLDITCDFDLYIALQFMVETKLLDKHSECLKHIRFLTMKENAVLHCDLLSHAEKCAVIENIQARKSKKEPLIPMPPHLSKETALRR